RLGHDVLRSVVRPRRGRGRDVLRSVVRPKRGLGDDWGDVLCAAHDDAGERYERDRGPELHAILPPPSANRLSPPVGTTFRAPRHDSSMFPLWRRRCAPSNPYPTWTLRFEADVTSLEAKIDTSAEDLDIFGKGGQPCRPRRSAPTACTHCLSREADALE